MTVGSLDEQNILFKYLPLSVKDSRLGLYVPAAGYGAIAANTEYPPTEHPDGHYFDWERGRILSNYQVIYITRGQGTFESELSGNFPVEAGDAFILFPGVRHRYKPDTATGWDEYWLEFNGKHVESLLEDFDIHPEKPVIKVGHSEEILKCYYQAFEEIRDEKPSFQFQLMAAATNLLATVAVAEKRQSFQGTRIEKVINKARCIFVENIDKTLDMKEVAGQLAVGYSWFRRMFKEYTGSSPAQYHLQLRLNKAESMLTNTRLTVKEISHKTGFQCSKYFSRLFRKKYGKSPEAFRKTVGR